jgi:hypothetical protein
MNGPNNDQELEVLEALEAHHLPTLFHHHLPLLEI